MVWKIGFDAKRLFNNFTGLGNYSRNLLIDLPKLYPDFEFHLYTPSINPALDEHAFHLDPFHIHLPTSPFKSAWRSLGITNNLIKDQIDLYHGLSNEIPFNVPGTKIKSVVTIHDLIFKIYPKTYSIADRIIYNIKFKYACKNADLIFACSESTKNDICNYYQTNPDKIKVLYQSCNPEFLINKNVEFKKQVLSKYHIPDDFLLYVGSIEPRKNLILLIDAYAQLPKDHQLPLVIVGKSSAFKQELINSANKYLLSDRLIFIHDLKSVKELSAVYQSARIFIYPSLYEGFGIPLIEAAFSKTAIITSNVASLPEAGGPYCNYFNPVHSEDLSLQIEKLLSNEELKQTSIDNTFNYANTHFTNTIIQEQLMQHYKNILEI